jgi:polyphosphate kinase
MVTVMLELRARFDEEANLEWKDLLEQEGVKVITGIPNLKVHAKVCLIKKKKKGRGTVQYGFVSTGNMNEKTARVYSDQCLLTSNRKIMADVSRIFSYLEKPSLGQEPLRLCKTLLVCPVNMRKSIAGMINREIAHAQAGKEASIILKVNSLSDPEFIAQLQRASRAGVKLQLIVRGIYCPVFEDKKILHKPYGISIVDEYLEHSRIMVFHNGGNTEMYISSADWMVRNLDHRVEAACPIFDEKIKTELLEILKIQLSDNVKARLLDGSLSNHYVSAKGKKKIISQVEIYNHLMKKKIESPMHERHKKELDVINKALSGK